MRLSLSLMNISNSFPQVKSIYDAMKEKGFPNLVNQRCPVNEDRAPGEECFDIMIEMLKKELQMFENIKAYSWDPQS